VQIAVPSPTVAVGHARHDEPHVWGSLGFTQAPAQACEVGAVHANAHATPPSALGLHAACPLPALVGPGQTMPQEPQLFGSVDLLTHPPLQLSGVLPEHPSPHMPLVQVAPPSPASGPSQTFVHVPQCAGSVGSSHVVPHKSDVAPVQPPSFPPPSVMPAS
jgi:hypothetical protein